MSLIWKCGHVDRINQNKQNISRNGCQVVFDLCRGEPSEACLVADSNFDVLLGHLALKALLQKVEVTGWGLSCSFGSHLGHKRAHEHVNKSTIPSVSRWLCGWHLPIPDRCCTLRERPHKMQDCFIQLSPFQNQYSTYISTVVENKAWRIKLFLH